MGSIERMAQQLPQSDSPPPPFSSQPIIFHPQFGNIHGPLYGTQENEHNIPPLQSFSQSLFPSYEEIQTMVENHLHQSLDLQTTLLESLPKPSSTNEPNTNQPHPLTSNEPSQTTHPHSCSQCEQMVQIGENIKLMLQNFQNETRFAIKHVLERLDALSYPNNS